VRLKGRRFRLPNGTVAVLDLDTWPLPVSPAPRTQGLAMLHSVLTILHASKILTVRRQVGSHSSTAAADHIVCPRFDQISARVTLNADDRAFYVAK